MVGQKSFPGFSQKQRGRKLYFPNPVIMISIDVRNLFLFNYARILLRAYRSEQFKFGSVLNNGRHVTDVKFLHQVFAVGFYRIRTDKQFFGNL